MYTKGLDLNQISDKLEKYIVDYFIGSKIVKTNEGLFEESHMFDFEEVNFMSGGLAFRKHEIAGSIECHKRNPFLVSRFVCAYLVAYSGFSVGNNI